MGRRWATAALALMSVVATAFLSAPVHAHDPSAWGGLYRSRDHGATWFLANEGRFVTAALGLAVNPTDPRELLLATDSGLLHSRNGGRDWDVAGGGTMLGSAFAVAIDADGSRALVALGGDLYRTDDRTTWQTIQAPAGAAPVRAMVTGAEPGRVYLAGREGLFRSDDWGATWVAADDGLPERAVHSVVVVPGPRETILIVSDGGLWASTDGGSTWLDRGNGLPPGWVESVALGVQPSDLLWAAGADQLFRSDDRGATWRPFGAPLDEPSTAIRGIAVAADGRSVVLTTDRGLYRSADGAATWELLLDNVPVHLEARPLVRDPRDPATLYAGFSIAPYEALWRDAADGASSLRRLDAPNLVGGLAFLILLGLVGGVALHRLGRYYSRPQPGRPVIVGGAASNNDDDSEVRHGEGELAVRTTPG